MVWRGRPTNLKQRLPLLLGRLVLELLLEPGHVLLSTQVEHLVPQPLEPLLARVRLKRLVFALATLGAVAPAVAGLALLLLLALLEVFDDFVEDAPSVLQLLALELHIHSHEQGHAVSRQAVLEQRSVPSRGARRVARGQLGAASRPSWLAGRAFRAACVSV